MKHLVHTTRFSFAIALVAMSTALPACASSTSPSLVESAAPKHGKPGSLVSISSATSKQKLSVGPMNVDLTLRSPAKVQEISITYQAEGQIRIEASAPAFVRPDSTGEARIQVPLTVLSKGLHYLNVFAVANGQTTAYSVRLDARDNNAIQKPMDTKTNSEFVELPARESRQP